MNFSSGAKKDLLVLNLCQAILAVRKSEEVKQDKDIVKFDNKSYRQNKKIDMFCDELQKKLSETLAHAFASSDDVQSITNWLRTKWKEKGLKLIMQVDPNTNLELLANQILFYNFCDREKPVHDTMQWLQDENMHFKLFDMLEQTNAKEAIENTNKDALRLISAIKG